MVTEKQAEERELVSPYFQIVTTAISISIFVFIVYQSLNLVHITDPEKTVYTVTPAEHREFGKYATDVGVGFHLNEFHELDFVKNKFVISGILWFLINIGDVSIGTLDQFNFSQGTVIEKSEPYTKIVDDKLLISYDILVNIKSSLSYKRFPIDDHSVNLTLENKFISPREIKFSSSLSDFQFRHNLTTSGWNILDKKVSTGYDQMKFAPQNDAMSFNYPIVSFFIQFKRSTMRDLVSVLLPLLLLFYLSIFSFSLVGSAATSISIGAITATLAYRFIIENISPKATYFKISDYIFILFLFLACLVFFTHLYDVHRGAFSLRAKKMTIIILHAIAILYSMYLLILS